MARSESYGGFEGASYAGWTGLANMALPSGTFARSGSYGVRSNPAGTPAGAKQRAGVNIVFGSGTAFAAYCQYFMYVVSLPTSNATSVGGMGDSKLLLQVNTNGTWQAVFSGIGTVTGGLALPTGKWLRVICKHWSHATGAPETFGTARQRAVIEIDDVDTDPSNPVNYGRLAGGEVNLSVTDYSNVAQVGCFAPDVGTYDIYFDDAVSAAASGLTDMNAFTKWLEGGVGPNTKLVQNGSIFNGSHIVPYLVTGQGALDEFSPAGDYPAVAEIPVGAGSVSSSTLNAATTYTHANAPAGGAIEGITLRANVRTASGSSTHALLLDGVEYARLLSTSSSNDGAETPLASITYYTPILDTVFNAIEFGVRNKTGTVSLVLMNLFLEVLSGVDILADVADPFTATPTMAQEAVIPENAEVTLSVETLGFQLGNQGVEINVPVTWQMERIDIGARGEGEA